MKLKNISINWKTLLSYNIQIPVRKKPLLSLGAQSGLGPGPGWGPYEPIGPLWAHKGPYGPIKALMGPILIKKLIILIRNHKIINKNIRIVNLEILKVKLWFGDKDLYS